MTRRETERSAGSTLGVTFKPPLNRSGHAATTVAVFNALLRRGQRARNGKNPFAHSIGRVACGRAVLRRTAAVRGARNDLAADLERREAAALLIEQRRDTS